MSQGLQSYPPRVIRRLTGVLFAGQSIASLGMTAAITVGSLGVTQLTGTTALAGLPTTVYILFGALGAYPAGRVMERYGRRAGLVLGFVIGALGGASGTLALVWLAAPLLILAHALMGLSRGTLDQGRYAAADLVTQEHRARAVGWVVLGGMVGGIGGPLLIGPTGRMAAQMGLDPLAGPYAAAMLAFLFGSAMIFTLLRPDPRDIGRRLAHQAALANAVDYPTRRLREIILIPTVQLAVAAMIFGQLVMVAVMVMTPLEMTQHLNHTLDDVSLVIAAHVVGMYASSVISGRIADRIGHAKTIIVGASLLGAACLLAPFAIDPLRLALALFTLGAGWNFCFVAGSSLLTDSLRPEERPRIQGTNDLVVGLVAATGSLSSGLLFAAIGYAGIAAVGITMALVLLFYAFWAARRPTTQETKATA